MLTEQEYDWLERRAEVYPQCLYCIHDRDVCPSRPVEKGGYTAYSAKGICWGFRGKYSLETDYKDAAEFEARVAEWLVVDCAAVLLAKAACAGSENFALYKDVYDYISSKLKIARLEVEKEMESEK